jgi:uncharacterized membrane protein YsdA (DUF1294 family)/cold shock CspA family protein
MQFKGTIVEWKDDRGFGFIEPSDGSEKVFCHIKAFAVRVRRPMAGDAVIYRTVKDAQGRLQATNVRPSGLERAAYKSNVAPRTPRSTHRKSPAATYVFITLFGAALVALLVMERIAYFVPLIYLVMSAITLMVYAFDKSAAMNGRWRTREQTLHLLELAGGWPGAVIAQSLFRHKASKTEFLIGFWLCVTLNLIALAIHARLLTWKLA